MPGAWALSRLPVVPVPKGLIGRPIDSREVADRMVELALSEPAGRVEDVGGPEVRTAVIYFHDSDRVTIVASKAGAGRHPVWFHNLLAHPDVVFGGIPMRAAVVGDSSREPLRGRRISNKEGAVSL